MKRLLNQTFLAFIFMALTSCSNDDSPPDDNMMAESVIGTWNLTELNVSPAQDVDGDGTSNSNVLEELDCVSGTLVFAADNTWDLTFNGVAVTSITNDLFIISCNSFTNTGEGTWQLQGNQLTLSQGVTTLFYTVNGNMLINTVGEDLPDFQNEVYTKQE